MEFQQMILPQFENLNAEQPEPLSNNFPAVWELVIEDMRNRDLEGQKKYGTQLQPFNGRSMLIDAYQEVLDLAVYLRGLIYEESTRQHPQIPSDEEVEKLRKNFMEHKDDPPTTMYAAYLTCGFCGYSWVNYYSTYVPYWNCPKCSHATLNRFRVGS